MLRKVPQGKNQGPLTWMSTKVQQVITQGPLTRTHGKVQQGKIISTSLLYFSSSGLSSSHLNQGARDVQEGPARNNPGAIDLNNAQEGPAREKPGAIDLDVHEGPARNNPGAIDPNAREGPARENHLHLPPHLLLLLPQHPRSVLL